MKTADRLIIIETKLKYLEKVLYSIIVLLLAQLGINVAI